MPVKEIILVGGFHEIVELAESCGYTVAGIFDNTMVGTYCDCPVLGNDQDAAKHFSKYGKIPVVITPDQPQLRSKLAAYYKTLGYSFVNLISPGARLSRSCHIGTGVVIQDMVNVSSNATIHDFVKLNSLCNIMHDSVIGEFSTVAPNAVILGRVTVGNHTYIGANATILPERKIGCSAIVGAGAVVTRNVIDNEIVVGNPAKKMSPR
jgi:sugar O-acyltransferase (sialic acid O-acetyltransferase NeuD family)